MNTVNLSDEKELKFWMKEVMVGSFLENLVGVGAAGEVGMILSRKEAAKFLQKSLVTLHDWMKKGLSSY